MHRRTFETFRRFALIMESTHSHHAYVSRGCKIVRKQPENRATARFSCFWSLLGVARAFRNFGVLHGVSGSKSTLEPFGYPVPCLQPLRRLAIPNAETHDQTRRVGIVACLTAEVSTVARR